MTQQQQVGEGSLHDRVHGMVLGLACAEAIGLPFTGQSRIERPDVEGWASGRQPLTWSSSTELLRAMIIHLGSPGSAPPISQQVPGEDLGTARARAPGRGRAAQEGTDILGVPAGAGNGAATGSCAVAVGEPDLDRVAADARAAARSTHPHEIGQDGAVAVAVATALSLRTPQRPLQLDSHGMLTAIGARVGSAPFRRALGAVGPLLDLRSTDQVADTIGTDRIASESVPAALVTLLRHADSYVATVKGAVLYGGDTARIAAMAGAICGARLGTAAIPIAWLQRLEHTAHLRALADCLLDTAARRTPVGTGHTAAAVPSLPDPTRPDQNHRSNHRSDRRRTWTAHPPSRFG